MIPTIDQISLGFELPKLLKSSFKCHETMQQTSPAIMNLRNNGQLYK